MSLRRGPATHVRSLHKQNGIAVHHARAWVDTHGAIFVQLLADATTHGLLINSYIELRDSTPIRLRHGDSLCLAPTCRCDIWVEESAVHVPQSDAVSEDATGALTRLGGVTLPSLFDTRDCDCDEEPYVAQLVLTEPAPTMGIVAVPLKRCQPRRTSRIISAGTPRAATK